MAPSRKYSAKGPGAAARLSLLFWGDPDDPDDGREGPVTARWAARALARAAMWCAVGLAGAGCAWALMLGMTALFYLAA